MVSRVLAALLAALAGFLLFGAAGALGAGAVLINLVTPLPAAVVGMRLGPQWSGLAVALTAAAIFAASGGLPVIFYAVQFGVPAALLPWLLTRGVPWDRSIVVTLGFMVAFGVVALIGVSSGSGQSPVAFIGAQIDREIDQAVTLMEEFAGTGQTPEEAEAFREMAAGMGAFMHRAYPGMLLVVGAALQLVTVGVLALAVRPGSLPGTPFARWRAPELLVWALIAAGFLVFFSAGPTQIVAINLLIILLPVYFLQGLAVVEHHLAQRGLSPWLRALIGLLLLLVNPLPMIVTGIGVFDLWADFRKPRVTKA